MIRPLVEDFEETSELEQLLLNVREATAGRIEDIEIFEGNKHAGTKALFSGRDGGRKVVLSLSKRPREGIAERVTNAGYGFSNEVEIAKNIGIVEAIQNHIAINYEVIPMRDRIAGVSPQIDGVCLQEYVKKRRFNLEEFRSFFRQIISSEKFLIDNEIYHRDLSPHNILVSKKGKLEAWITDLGSACKKDQAKIESLKTRGARTVRDPRVSEGNRYSDAQEIYAIAQNMLYSLNGKPAVKYDSNSIKNWNCETHDALVNQAIKELPKWARKRYGKLIYKAMSSEGGYYCLADFEKDFEKASKTSLIEKLKTDVKTKITAVGLAGVVAIAGIGGPLLHRQYRHLEDAVKDASLYPVTTDYKGEGMEIVSNLIELDPLITNDKRDILYGHDFFGRVNIPQFLHLQKGQTITILPYLNQKALPEPANLNCSMFRGKIYFEGFNGVDFSSEPIIIDPYDYEMGGPIVPEKKLTVPLNMQDGCYNLVIEAYAYDIGEKYGYGRDPQGIKFDQPGKAIVRRPIKVVIGEPKDYLFTRYFREGMFPSINLGNHYRREDPNNRGKCIEPNTTVELSFPEINYAHVSNLEGMGEYSNWSRFPEFEKSGEYIAQIVTRKDGEITGYQFFPLKVEKFPDSKLNNITYARPGPDFSEKIVKYRQKLYHSQD